MTALGETRAFRRSAHRLALRLAKVQDWAALPQVLPKSGTLSGRVPFPTPLKKMTDRDEAGHAAPAHAVQIEALYRALFEASSDGVLTVAPDGQVVEVNPSMLRVFEEPVHALLGFGAAQLFSDPAEWRSLQDLFEREGVVSNVETRLRRRDGRQIPALVTVLGHRGLAGEIAMYQLIVRDLTRQMDAEERLSHEALHDPLTQLPNRRHFFNRVSRVLERHAFKPDFLFAVVFIDLDRFKLVNDSLGHRWGDELLILVGQRLASLVRPEDIVARLGGDEFAVLLLDLPGIEQAEQAAVRVHEGMAEVFTIRDHPVHIGASLGMALSTGTHDSADDLIRDADTAMYEAKAAGGGGWALFDESMRSRVAKRLTLESELRLALERQEFAVHYQPLFSMETGSLTGFEALLRWQHPHRDLLLPGEFLSVAEETGLIVPIGKWVLREVCAVAAQWRREMTDVPVIAINVSPQQILVPGLAIQIAELLEEFELPGSSLRIEITERTFLDYSESLSDTLLQIEALGVDLCLDEIGSHYSILGSLRGLPFSTIKIDRGFVRQLFDEGGVGTVETILSLVRQMGLIPIVEGVETETEMAHLRRIGCDAAQGHLFSGAVAVTEARSLLKLGRIPVPAAEREGAGGAPDLPGS